MGVESLNEYLRGSFPKKSLRKIYLSHKIQEKIQEVTGEKVKVTLRLGTIVLTCDNAAQATVLKANERKIYAATAPLLQTKTIFRYRVG